MSNYSGNKGETKEGGAKLSEPTNHALSWQVCEVANQDSSFLESES